MVFFGVSVFSWRLSEALRALWGFSRAALGRLEGHHSDFDTFLLDFGLSPEAWDSQKPLKTTGFPMFFEGSSFSFLGLLGGGFGRVVLGR